MLPGVFSTTYQKDAAIVQTRAQWLVLAVSLVVILTFPLYCGGYWLSWFNILFISIVAVLGLHILTGLCGLFSVAQGALMAIAAYTAAILPTRFGWSCWSTLPLGVLASGLVALFFGTPSLRIKGFYFALATLAASFVIIWVLEYLQGWTGGTTGMRVPALMLGSIDFGEDFNFFYLCAVAAILAVIVAKNIQRTQSGRAFVAIRDGELAAQVMGVNLLRHKSLALFVSGLYAGVAGWLWAHQVGYIVPSQFGLMSSMWMVGMLLVGGLGSTSGAVAGVVLVKLLDILSHYVTPVVIAAFPSTGNFIASVLGTILYAVAIVLFIMLEPRGLSHRWEMLKAAYRRLPY